MMDDWLPAALPVCPAVLVTVARVEGSVPREAGAKMLVMQDCFTGTIGGGHLEHRALDIARTLLVQAGAAFLQRFALGPGLGQCCGGIAHLAFELLEPAQLALLAARRHADSWRVIPLVRAAAAHGCSGGGDGGGGEGDSTAAAGVVPTGVGRAGGVAARPTWSLCDAEGGLLGGAPAVAFERTRGTHVLEDAAGRCWLVDAILAPRAHLMLFGAGHVGAAIVRVLGSLPCRVTWVDERDDLFPAVLPPNVHCEATDTPEALVAQAAPGTSFLVMTHSHALDLRLTIAILSRPASDWFGLIGSMTKRRQFEHRLHARGVDPARSAAMVCPIGLPGIAGKAPAVIAVAVVAQLLSVWEAAATSRTGATSATRLFHVSSELH